MLIFRWYPHPLGGQGTCPKIGPARAHSGVPGKGTAAKALLEWSISIVIRVPTGMEILGFMEKTWDLVLVMEILGFMEKSWDLGPRYQILSKIYRAARF